MLLSFAKKGLKEKALFRKKQGLGLKIQIL